MILDVQVVQDQDFDVIAFETISNLKEAQAICHLLKTEPSGKPAWLSFGCKDGATLTHGESLAKDVVPLTFEVTSSSSSRRLHIPTNSVAVPCQHRCSKHGSE
jgi:hypothetical protein